MPDTLIEMLAQRAGSQGERAAFVHQDRPHGFAGLWDTLNRCATGLRYRGLVRGERVVIALPNGPDFFAGFYGVQRAGGIPVPLNPASGARRIARICGHADARFVISESDGEGELRGMLQAGRTRILHPAECRETGVSEDFPSLSADDVCFIQYTSGSTGDPKGVILSHGNLLANLRQLIAGMRITEDDVFVSWLPLSHDMGLILMSMVPFYLAARLILLPAELTNVQPWLRAIQSHRGSFTAAPDFAYRFCIRYLREPQSFDLSSLRVALNAAEPVRAQTLREFERRFGLHNVMLPGYGLAEASVGVSTWIPGRPVPVDENGVVCVGPPFPGMEVRVESADPDSARQGPGEILLRGPSITRGYHENPAANARLAAGDGFIRTGDQGYLDAQGYLYITGRLKDIIIHAGRNIAPREAEEVLDGLAFVRQCAALGIDKGGMPGEQVYLFAETRPGPHRPAAMADEIVQRFHAHFGFRPGRVYLLRRHGIPRTANGKLQRALLKERYLQGRLEEEGFILFPDE